MDAPRRVRPLNIQEPLTYNVDGFLGWTFPDRERQFKGQNEVYQRSRQFGTDR